MKLVTILSFAGSLAVGLAAPNSAGIKPKDGEGLVRKDAAPSADLNKDECKKAVEDCIYDRCDAIMGCPYILLCMNDVCDANVS